MCKRQLLVELVKERGVSKAEAARQCGMSRAKAYKWLARFEAGGLGALDDWSRARSETGRFEGELAEAFVELRREHPTWGPRKLIDCFERNTDAELPAASTVGGLLKRRGLVRERGRRPRHPLVASSPTRSNDSGGSSPHPARSTSPKDAMRTPGARHAGCMPPACAPGTSS